MKKYLWMFGVLVLLAGVVTYHHEDQSKNSASKSAAPYKPLVFLDEPPDTSKDSTEPERDSPGWNLAYLVFGWPNGITDWALFLTMTVIAEQTRETKRAAEAALKQTDHAVASERAWLTAEVVNPDPPDNSRLIWIEVPITNRGKTPARIHSIAVTSKLVPPPTHTIADFTPGKLPPIPDYSDHGRVMPLRDYDLIIAPEDTFRHMHVYIQPSEWIQIGIRNLTLYVYGTIEYFDTVGGDSTSPVSARFMQYRCHTSTMSPLDLCSLRTFQTLTFAQLRHAATARNQIRTLPRSGIAETRMTAAGDGHRQPFLSLYLFHGSSSSDCAIYFRAQVV